MLDGVIEVGTDEAGRGPLAGPVYAAAVILPPDFQLDELNDSKQLTEKQRYKLRPIIEEKAVDNCPHKNFESGRGRKSASGKNG